MKGGDYNNQIFKQLQAVMEKCDDLSQEMKQEKKFEKEKKVLNEKIDKLENKVKKLENENQILRDDNDRLKKQLNNDSNNSSKPPSSDIKKNISNNREKSNKKAGGQKGHTAHFLSKKIVKDKIKSKEFKHEVINIGNKDNSKTKYISKYVLDFKIDIVAKEYRFFKDEKGKYNIPKEFYSNVQYGNELKTMCAVLNTEGIVALDKLADFVSCISHEKINISKASIVNFMKDLDNKSRYIIKNIEEKNIKFRITSYRCNNSKM